MAEASEAYHEVCKFVQNAEASVLPKNKKGPKPHRRDFKGRVFPKASIRALARKANIKRLAYGPSSLATFP